MAGQIGIVKQISGLVFAIDQSGNKRVLNEKDVLFLGEMIKPQDDATATIQMNNGKEISVNSADTLMLDQSVSINESFANEASVNPTDLQQAILSGVDLSTLEETAAGAPNAGGGSDLGGTSLSSVSFLDGGHETNVNSNYNGLEVINTSNVSSINLGTGAANSSLDTVATNAIARNPLVKSIYFLENTSLIQDGYDRKSVVSVEDGKIFISKNSKVGDKITTNFEDGVDKSEYIVTKEIIQKGYIEDSRALSAVQTNYLDDGYLNKNELLRDGDASKTPVRMTFDSAIAGDKLGYRLSDGEIHTVTLTQADINRGYVDVSVDVPSHGSNLQVQAGILQQDRFNDENATQNSVKIDTKAGKYKINALDDTNGDNVMSISDEWKYGEVNGRTKTYYHTIRSVADSDVENGDYFIGTFKTDLETKHYQELSTGQDIDRYFYVVNHGKAKSGIENNASVTVVDKAGNVGETSEATLDVHYDGRYNIVIDKVVNDFGGKGKVYGHLEHYKDTDYSLKDVQLQFENGNKNLNRQCVTDEDGKFEFDIRYLENIPTYKVHVTTPDGVTTEHITPLDNIEGSGKYNNIDYKKDTFIDFQDGVDILHFYKQNSQNFDGFHGKIKNVENISLHDTKINLDVKDILDIGQDRIRISGYGKSSVKLSGFDKVEDTSHIENIKENTSYFTNADRTVILEVHNNVTVEM